MKLKYFLSVVNSIPLLVVIGLFLYSFIVSNLHIATPFFILIIYLSFLMLFIGHNAYLINPDLKDLKKRIEQYIIKNTYVYSKKEKAIGDLDIFEEEEYEKYRNDTVAKLAPSVFPILGIFFTFASIALFMPEFTSKNADSLNTEITELLQGVGTAFYASMYGLGMLLWWQFWEQKGMNNIESKIKEVITEYTSKFWTNEELELIKLKQQDGLENSLKSSIQAALSPEFINQLNEQLTSQLSNLSKIISTETDIHKNLLVQFDKFTVFQGQLMDRQELLVGSYDLILTNNKNIVNEQEKNLEQIGKVNNTIYEKLTILFNRFDNSTDKLDLFSNKSEQLLESFNTLKIRLDETMYNFDSVVALTDNMEQLTNKIEDSNKNYDSILNETSNTFKEIVNQNNQIKELFSDKIDLINNNSSSLVEHSKSLNNIIEKIDLEGFTTNMINISNQVEQVKKSFSVASSELKESINLFNDNIVDKVKEVFKTIDIENAEVLDRLLGGFRDIQKHTNKFEDSIESLNNEFVLFNEQLSKMIEKE